MSSQNYCAFCGVSIPDGQKFCSMCCGDIDYGTDGYYRKYMERWEKVAREQYEREQQEEDTDR